jgi:hypothetical protein
VVIKGVWHTRQVWMDERELSPVPSQEVWNHSPAGFNWSYGGSGPAQLALALLLEFTNRARAVRHHQDFKWRVIAKLPPGDFAIDASVIADFLREVATEQREQENADGDDPA